MTAVLTHSDVTPTSAGEGGQRFNPPASWGARIAVLALAVELVIFGVLVGAYVVFRASHPEVARAGLGWFGWKWGAGQLAVVVLAGLTAWLIAPRLRTGRDSAAMVLSAIVAVYGLAAVGLKGVEWSRWGGPRIISIKTEQNPTAPGKVSTAAPVGGKGDAQAGAKAFGQTCAACHGPVGEGIANVAPAVKGTDFMRQSTDAQVRAVIINGRTAGDPASKTGKVMPARGGNPFLSDADVVNIMAFFRSDAAPAAGGASAPAASVPRWVVPPAPAGPPGVTESTRLPPSADPPLPAELRWRTPGIQERALAPLAAAMSLLHALHLLIGVAVMVALVWLSYAAPVHGIALAKFARGYWLAAVVMWLVLFPLMYLL